MKRSFVYLLLFCSVAAGQDWFQFMGPGRNNTISETGFVTGWTKTGVRELWRVPVGEGYSGIVSSAGRIYTMDSQNGDEFVFALGADTGKELWRIKLGSSPRDVYGGLGPRVTPTIDGNLLFTVSANGELIALQASNGKEVWKRNLKADHGWRAPAEGTSCSPLIANGRIFLINGGTNGRAAAAFDRNTGKTVWLSQDDRPSYSSPVLWNLHNTIQVLFLTGSKLFSLNAATGALLWKYDWPTYDFVNAATPLLIAPDRVFISAGYDQGAAMLRISNSSGWKVVEIWRNREMKNHFSNSVFHQETIYGFDNSILKAVDARTGKMLWRESGFGNGSILLTADYLLILSERGELIAARADPAGFTKLKEMEVLSGKSWTPPSLVKNTLFLRNHNQAVALASQAPK